MPPGPRTLPTLLAHAAASARAGAGVACGDAHWTWAEVQRRAHGFARALRAHGIAPGDRVAFYLEPSLELAVGLFGAWCAGAIAVPAHGKLRDAQVAHVLRDAGARVVCTSPDKLAYLRDPDATFAERLRVLTGAGVPPGHAFEDWCAIESGALPAVDERALAVLLYTSGSTGLPKGIVQDHHNLVHGAEIVSGYLGLRARDRILGVLPLSFDYGLNQLLDAALLGATIALHGYFTVHDLAQAIGKHRATVLAGVPSLWAAVSEALRSGALPRASCMSLRVLTNSGGRLHERDSRTLREHLPQAQVFAMYGLTEAFRSSYLPPSELAARPTSIGKAIPGVELLVVDPVTGAPCAPGQVGELVHAGALVARGYWNNAEATARRFRPHPRDHGRGLAVFSGDLVRQDADGFFYFVARNDAQLKVSGHRVSPDEVEVIVNGVPGVQLGVVVGLDDPVRADTRLVAVVVAEVAAADLPARVLAACKRALPAYMVPAEVRVLAALPLNPNGKPDRAALAQLLAAEGG